MKGNVWKNDELLFLNKYLIYVETILRVTLEGLVMFQTRKGLHHHI